MFRRRTDLLESYLNAVLFNFSRRKNIFIVLSRRVCPAFNFV